MKYVLEIYSPSFVFGYNFGKRYSLYRFPMTSYKDRILLTNSKEQLLMTMDVLGIRDDMKFYRFMRNGGDDINPILYAVMTNFNNESSLINKYFNFDDKKCHIH